MMHEGARGAYIYFETPTTPTWIDVEGIKQGEV